MEQLSLYKMRKNLHAFQKQMNSAAIRVESKIYTKPIAKCLLQWRFNGFSQKIHDLAGPTK
jgi:hypothetical protein